MIHFVCCFFFSSRESWFSVVWFVEAFHVYIRIMLSRFASPNERWERRWAREWFLSFPIKVSRSILAWCFTVCRGAVRRPTDRLSYGFRTVYVRCSGSSKCSTNALKRFSICEHWISYPSVIAASLRKDSSVFWNS